MDYFCNISTYYCAELKKEERGVTRKKVGIDSKVGDFRVDIRSRHDFAIKTYPQTNKTYIAPGINDITGRTCGHGK